MPIFSTDRETAKLHLQIVVRGIFVFAIITIFSLQAGLYLAKTFLPKSYTATAVVQVPPPPTSDIPASRSSQVEIRRMKSPEFLIPIISDLALDKAWAQRVFKSKEDTLPLRQALEHMEKILRIDLKPGANATMSVTAASDDPKEATDIANAVANRYKMLRNVEHPENPVQIISPAVQPTEPSHPNKTLVRIACAILALLAAAVVASFVEVVFLFTRASQR